MRYPVDALRGALAVLLAGIVACRTDHIPTSPTPPTTDADAWSGNPLVMRSSAFAGADSLPTVITGTETLTVRSFGADSASVLLPDTNGSLTLSVRLRSGTVLPSLSVRVHGFRAITAGPSVSGKVYPWPVGGVPAALAFHGNRLVSLDFRYNTAIPLTADTNLGSRCFLHPMPSAEPGFVVVAPHDSTDNCTGKIVAVPTSSLAGPADSGPVGGWPSQLAAHLRRGRWLLAVGNDTRLSSDGSVGCGQTYGFVVSPRGDRVVPLCGAATGSPVIDAASSVVAYTFPEARWIWAAGFDQNGDTLFAVREDSLGHSDLIAADATTGRVLSQVPRASLGAADWSAALVSDPGRPWLYVLGWTDSLLPYFDVLDRATLTRVATLRLPSWAGAAVPRAPWGHHVGDWTLLVSPLERRLYAMMDNEPWPVAEKPISVLTFDLMP